jgi:predicted dithiol-disulfide oxidoreductase (DUF899 family)
MDEVGPARLAHLQAKDTAFAAISRAPFAKLAAYKAARGWSFDWFSSHGTEFNYDFHVTLDASVEPVLFNYRDADELAHTTHAWVAQAENHPSETSALSFFLRDGTEIFHTYTTYQRGTEAGTGTFQILDLSPLGRQENWEEPKDRVAHAGPADPSFGGGLV